MPSTAPRKPALAALLALALLTACASPFAFRVRSSAPAEIGSVFVLFGKDSSFQGKQHLREIVQLIQPAELSKYPGYTEWRFDLTDTGATWVQLSERLPGSITLELDPEEPGVLAFELDRDLLDLHPQLGLAVVVRTAGNEYRMKSWERSLVAEAEGELFIDVTGTEITGVLK